MNRGSYQRVYAGNSRMLVGPAMIRSVQLTRARVAYEYSAMPPPTYTTVTIWRSRLTPTEHDGAGAATGALPTR
jgi:hypothetical protein